MEKKVIAILLKSSDLRENDRSVRLFSAQEGIITATMRGVKKNNAKLKFASQPFAFCEYELTQKGGAYIVTGATVVEDTYSLCQDPEKYASAGLVCEVVDKASTSIDSASLFIILLKTLKALLYSSISAPLIVAKFIQKVLSMSGFISLPTNRVNNDLTTPGGTLDEIAYRTLDDLASISVSKSVVMRAIKIICITFEQVYESSLVCLRIFYDIFGE
jgi:hypothetical protein